VNVVYNLETPSPIHSFGIRSTKGVADMIGEAVIESGEWTVGAIENSGASGYGAGRKGVSQRGNSQAKWV